MRKSAFSFSLLLATAIFMIPGQSIDKDHSDSDGFSSREWAIIKTLSPLPDLPVDTTNKYRDSPTAALLGQKLFFEPRLSGPIQTGTPARRGSSARSASRARSPAAIATCRNRSGCSTSARTTAGPFRTRRRWVRLWMTRNVSSIVNTVFYVHPGSGAHWRENDGYSDSEWFDAQSEPEGPPVQNGSRLQLAHVIFEHYHDDYTDAFPEWPLDPGLADYSRFPATGSPYTDTANWNSLSAGDKEIVNRILVNYGKAIEAYLRKLVSRNAPFDRYVAGKATPSATGEEGSQALHRQRRAASTATTRRSFRTTISTSSVCTSTRRSRRTPIRPRSGARLNQALICNPSVADGDFNVNGHFSDDPATAPRWQLLQPDHSGRSVAYQRPSPRRRDRAVLPRRPSGDARRRYRFLRSRRRPATAHSWAARRKFAAPSLDRRRRDG